MGPDIKIPDNEGNENFQSGKKGMSRRAMLQGILGTVGALAVGAGLENEVKAQEKTSEQGFGANLTPKETSSESQEHSEHGEQVSTLDMGTAAAVVASFGRHVLYNGAMKDISLGPKSAAEVGGLAVGRIAALKFLGNVEDQKRAAEELHEIFHGLIPLPVLVALSDATTSSLKVDSKRILGEVKDALQEEKDYSAIQRPKLSADIKEWQDHLEKVNTDLVSKAAKIAAVTSVLAPIGTTYASSSLANEMKVELMHILYEQSYALAVLRRKNIVVDGGNEIMFDEEIHEEATKRADELFNGPMGYSKLMITLAANIQGAYGLGDPPEIYFALKHGNNAKRMAMAHAAGFANSEISTVLLNGMWLKAAGIARSGALYEFLGGQMKVLKTLKDTVFDKDLRDVSFFDGRGYVDGVTKMLEKQNGERAKSLLGVLRSIPRARLQFSPRDYIAQKMQFLRDSRMKDIPDISSAALRSADAFAQDPYFDDYRKALAHNDLKKANAMLRKMKDKIQLFEAERLSELFEGIVEEGTLSEISSSDVKGTFEKTEVQKQHFDSVVALSDRVFTEVAFGKNKLVNHKDLSARELYGDFAKIDESTLAAAMKQFTKLEKSEDAIEGFAKGAHPGESIEDARKHVKTEVDTHFLSHSAKEVLWALCTQIPSVPAIARVAGVAVPKVVGVKVGEKPTAGQLKGIIGVTYGSEAGMSSSADNAAAYLFGEQVNGDMLSRKFGKDVFKKYSFLEDWSSIFSLKVAEQAGSLYKLGNGPNFSQEKVVILRDKSSAQGISVNQEALPMGDTLPHKNLFALAANGLLLGVAYGVMSHMIDKAEALENGNAKVA